jgi:hypothetical protein
LNISEIVAQKHLLARITALEIAVAMIEKSVTRLVLEKALEEMPDPLHDNLTDQVAMKRKPGRPRKNA